MQVRCAEIAVEIALPKQSGTKLGRLISTRDATKEASIREPRIRVFPFCLFCLYYGTQGERFIGQKYVGLRVVYYRKCDSLRRLFSFRYCASIVSHEMR